MRIGIDITPLSNGEKTGIGMYVHNLLSYLALIDKQNDYFLLYGSARKIGSFSYPNKFKIVSFYKYKESLSYTLNLNRVIESLKLDIFHATATIGCPGGICIPVISTIHDIFPLKYKTNSSMYFKFLYKIMSRNMLRYSSLFIYNSFATKNEFCNFYKKNREKGNIIYLGPSFENNSQSFRTKSGPIICVGAIEERKNQLFLAKLYSKLLEKRDIELPDLIFIGPSRSQKVDFYELIKSFKTQKIKWLNYLSDEELKKYYTNSSLMLYPSIDEGFGIPLVDAMNCSLPVICSNIPIFREIGEDYPIFAKVNDEEDWVNKIINFYSADYLNMEEKSKKLMINYSWEKYAKETLECYKRVVADS